MGPSRGHSGRTHPSPGPAPRPPFPVGLSAVRPLRPPHPCPPFPASVTLSPAVRDPPPSPQRVHRRFRIPAWGPRGGPSKHCAEAESSPSASAPRGGHGKCHHGVNCPASRRCVCCEPSKWLAALGVAVGDPGVGLQDPPDPPRLLCSPARLLGGVAPGPNRPTSTRHAEASRQPLSQSGRPRDPPRAGLPGPAPALLPPRCCGPTGHLNPATARPPPRSRLRPGPGQLPPWPPGRPGPGGLGPSGGVRALAPGRGRAG